MTHLWKEIHLVSSVSTSPDVIMSSAKSFGSIPNSSCRWKSIPDFCRSSTDSGANMSSLEPAISTSTERGGPERRIFRARRSAQHSLYAEMKVELPGRHVLGVVPVFVGERETNLNDLEQVDVTSHRLVVVVRRGLETAYWTCDYAGKFCVLER